jgi:hypothetical protein
MEQDTETHRNPIYALMWDCYGLEACERVPDSADTTFALLKNEKPPRPPNLLHWQLRARYNTQRHYEIWIITAQPGIEQEDIVEMFQTNPQTAADTIRRIGQCFYSDRQSEERIVIR